MIKHIKLIVTPLALAMALAGCMSLAPKYERPAAPVAGSFPDVQRAATAPGNAASAEAPAAMEWQRYFADARLRQLIELSLAERADPTATLVDLKHITDQLLVRNPSYRCTRCGFGARSHHWQCPSCKEWGSVKPLLNYAVV